MQGHFRAALTVVVIAGTGLVSAQRPADIVKWSASPRAAVKVGAPAGVELTANIEKGWHLYALTQPKGGPNPLKVALAPGAPFTIDPTAITAPPPDVVKDANFDLETRQYEGRVVFGVPLRPTHAASAGAHDVVLEITFQACGHGICLRPYTQKLPVAIAVTGGAAR